MKPNSPFASDDRSDRRCKRKLCSAFQRLRCVAAVLIGVLLLFCVRPTRALQQGAQTAASTFSQTAATAGRPTATTSLPAEPPVSFLIAGVVIDSVTKAPIPNAALTIEPMTTVRKLQSGANRRGRRRPQTQTQVAAAVADATGHFQLEAPSAGGWALTASARGYKSQALDEHEGYSTAVVLTDVAPKADVTFRLTPASIIEGYIFDEAGEPVRSAQLALSFIPPPTPENGHPKPQVRAQQATDDRGFYKFSGNGPGSYQIRVTAHPWYATTGQRSMENGDETGAASAPGLDPLDVVYPTVWYPGATDPAAASVIVLRGGETQEANLRLLPEPATHLIVRQPTPTAEAASATRADDLPSMPAVFTYATRLMPDGSEEPATSVTTVDGQGNTDIGGLVAGTYLLHQQSPSSQNASLATLQIGPNSGRTIDFASAVPATKVAVQLSPPVENDSIQIAFKDVETGHISYVERSQDSGPVAVQRAQRRAGASAADRTGPHPDRTVSLAPGKYDVTLNGPGDVHLASIEAAGAAATGRTVTIDGGAPRLLLHTASGRSVVSGVVSSHGQPDAGAMVLLIPSTFGDPAGIDLPGRDQSNSDGSFEMSGILPGGYILVAIDRGWDVNWSDPSTLRRYLVRGVALDVRPSADLKERIEAVAP